MYVTTVIFLYLLRFVRVYSTIYKNVLYYLILVFLFLFSALRFEVGCDWRGYLISLSKAGAEFNFLAEFTSEPVFFLILHYMKMYDINYVWINIVSSLIFFYGAHYMAQRQQNKLAFLILLFPVLIINMPMSGIRQASAVGFLFIAFTSLLDRSALRFTIAVFLAFLFHKSAIIFLGLLPLAFGDLTKFRILIFSIILIPITAILIQSDSFAAYLMRYGSTGLAEEAGGAIFRTGFLALTSIHFLIFLRKKWKKNYKSDYQIILIFSLLMLLPLIASQFSSVMGDRLGYYFIPMQVLIFTRIPYLQLTKEQSFHLTYPYIASMTLFIAWVSFSNIFDVCYRPYKSLIFSDHKILDLLERSFI